MSVAADPLAFTGPLTAALVIAAVALTKRRGAPLGERDAAENASSA